MIFSIIMALTNGLQPELLKNSVDFVSAIPAGADYRRLGDLLVHRCVDTGGDHGRVSRGGIHQGQHQSGERHQGVGRGFEEGGGDLHPVRAEGHVQYLPGGVLLDARSFAFFEPYFFIGYLISIALFGLYQAIFMANAGGAWDNAKKIVEVELKAKGTPLHDATVVGDTVGDPFKDTSSVALNPIIKFTTLFGLLAVELAVSLSEKQGNAVSTGFGVLFLLISLFFVHRSFYGMRIVVTKS